MVSPVREGILKEVKDQWRTLWSERIDDKVRAEGIANKDYSMLFVEKGTVIFATRDFKPLDFGKILRIHEVIDADGVIPPSSSVGGWGTFIRTKITGQKRCGRIGQTRQYSHTEKRRQHLKKGGKGWLHF